VILPHLPSHLLIQLPDRGDEGLACWATARDGQFGRLNGMGINGLHQPIGSRIKTAPAARILSAARAKKYRFPV
jgi:hypothetical protein